jgi:hypothetical protein
MENVDVIIQRLLQKINIEMCVTTIFAYLWSQAHILDIIDLSAVAFAHMSRTH